MRFIFVLAISYYFKKRINCDIINLDKGLEHGRVVMQRTRNPSNRVKRRRGSNPLDSFYKWIFLPYLKKNYKKNPVTNTLTPFPPDCIRLHQEVFFIHFYKKDSTH